MSLDFVRLLKDQPVRRKPNKDSFPTQGKVVKQWIDALPLANSGVTAKMLYNGLKELNTLEVDPIARLETLELLRQPINFTLGGMDKHVIGQPLPLPQQKRQIGQVMKDFHRELSLGYKLAIIDMCGPKGAVPFLRGRYALLAVVRAMEHIAALLGKCYLTYSEVPAGAWAELNMLFSYAISQNLHEKLEKDPQLAGVSISPLSCYLQAALMFLTNPYRLTQREIVDVEAATRVWAAFAALRLDSRGEGVFLIDADSDSGPGVRVGDAAKRVWRLDCAGLVQNIRGQFDAVGRDGLLTPRSKLGQSVPLPLDLIERVLVAWGFGGERVHQRMPAGHMLEVAIGLQSAHYLIGANKDFNMFVGALSQIGVALTERERSAAWAQASSESAKPTLSRVEVQDQSLGGYRIYWPSAANLRAKVGELIVLSAPVEEDDDDPRDWLVGVLRWLRGGNNDSLEAGIQLLTRKAEAVAIRATTEGRNKVLHRGLMLTPLKHESGAQTSLLCNTLLDAGHSSELLQLPDEFALSIVKAATPIAEMKQLENTGSYKLFSYSLIGGPAPEELDQRPGAELEAIWSTV
jgi:cyclic-di-GMP-binding protein